MDIETKVRDTIARHLDDQRTELTDEQRLDSLGIASLDTIEIIFALEEEFGITLPFEGNNADQNTLVTVHDLIVAVRRQIAETSSAS